MDTTAVLARHFDGRCLASTRTAVFHAASDQGLAGEPLTDFLIAVNECVTNALAHGGGRGSLSLWRTNGGLLCEITDTGPGIPARALTEGPLPPPGAPGGRGIWLTRRLADQVSFLTGPAGTTVRLSMRVKRPEARERRRERQRSEGSAPMRWNEMSKRQQGTLIALASVEVALTAAAAADLCLRPAGDVRGRKGLWWMAIFVQPVGPLAYLLWGRRP
ncbi:ATP-binding protein [Nonomuraea sp. NPDC050022]|uniref:ATP-binding protein n=1 Tax=Nonomuraea sp. NPDC050022 TaxID=3364358 RepID=UPI0037B9DCD5